MRPRLEIERVGNCDRISSSISGGMFSRRAIVDRGVSGLKQQVAVRCRTMTKDADWIAINKLLPETESGGVGHKHMISALGLNVSI